MLTQIAKEVLKDVSHWIGYYVNVMSDDDISGVIPYDKPIQKSRMKENMEVANETAANWDTETFQIIRLSKTPTVI